MSGQDSGCPASHAWERPLYHNGHTYDINVSLLCDHFHVLNCDNLFPYNYGKSLPENVPLGSLLRAAHLAPE